MARFHKMVDLARTPAEKVEAALPAPASTPDYPYGLCICLTQDELSKLDLDDEVEVGDMIHLFAMAEVTSVSKVQRDGEASCRVELQVTHLAVEDEDDEDAPDDD